MDLNTTVRISLNKSSSNTGIKSLDLKYNEYLRTILLQHTMKKAQNKQIEHLKMEMSQLNKLCMQLIESNHKAEIQTIQNQNTTNLQNLFTKVSDEMDQALKVLRKDEEIYESALGQTNQSSIPVRNIVLNGFSDQEFVGILSEIGTSLRSLSHLFDANQLNQVCDILTQAEQRQASLDGALIESYEIYHKAILEIFLKISFDLIDKQKLDL